MAKKPAKFPQILLANRLDNGLTVWLSEDGSWTGPLVSPLKLQDDPSLQRALSSAHQDALDNIIIDPFSISVSEDLVPNLLKHKILLSGPTVRRDLGWQAKLLEEKRHVSL